MNTESSDPTSSHPTSDPAAQHMNGHGPAKPYDFIRRAKSMAKRLPTRIDEQFKQKPYTALAVACLLGAGAGVVLSSRILRVVLTAAVSAAAVELTRSLVRDAVTRV